MDPRTLLNLVWGVAGVAFLTALWWLLCRRPRVDPAPAPTPPKDFDPKTPVWAIFGNIVEDRPHGEGGHERRSGTKHFPPGAKVYLFPPLWGPDSFNDGAGLHRVLTAARFIKARMPLGEPTLTDDEAFDVAAFINSKPRPRMANLENDYPDRSLKPIDNPYGPFADDFPLEQHRFGPFQPIEEFYKARAKK